jgi:hypothetical protein
VSFFVSFMFFVAMAPRTLDVTVNSAGMRRTQPTHTQPTAADAETAR